MFIIQQREPVAEKRRVYMHLVDATDGITAKTGQTGQAKISVNGGAPVNTTNSIVEIDSANTPGLYYVELLTSELSSYGYIAIRFKNASVAEFQDIGQVIAYDPYSRTQVYNAWDSGAPDIDYKKVRTIVREELAALPKPPEPEKDDDTTVLEAIQGVKNAVLAIEMPEQRKIDLEPLKTSLKQILDAVNAIEMPEQKEIDLSDIRQALKDFGDLKVSEVNLKQAEITGLLDKIHNFFAIDIEDVKKDVSALNKKFDDIPYVVVERKPNDQPTDNYTI